MREVEQGKVPTAASQSSKFLLYHRDEGSRNIKPILSIGAFPKSKLINILLSKGIDTATKIQEYMWPIVSKTYSLVAVGPKATGKSYGYLIPLMDTVMKQLDDQKTKQKYCQSTAPLAVILCPSWRTVMETEETLKTVERELKTQQIGRYGNSHSSIDNLKILAIFEGERKLKQNVSLINGCHILISTPPSLLRIVNAPQEQRERQGNISVTNLQQCSHLIFENADEGFERYDAEVAEVMAIMHASRAKEREEREKLARDSSHIMFDQVILVSRKWCESIRKFVHKFMIGSGKVGPYFVFYDHLEAAVYGKARIASHLVGDFEAKLQKMMDILHSYDSGIPRKILIHCNDESTAKKLDTYFRSNVAAVKSIQAFSFPVGETSAFETRDIVATWKWKSTAPNVGGFYYPLLLPDNQDVEALDLFENGDCEDFVIMFDLPENSKKSFSQRFAQIQNSFVSFYNDENPIEDSGRVKPTCHILITPNDREKLKSIFMFLKRISTQQTQSNTLPKELANLYRRFQEEDAKAKSNQDLCLQIKMFGTCATKRTCPLRHYIDPKADFEQSVIAQENVFAKCKKGKQSGATSTFEYDVIKVNSANHFYVRLKRSKDQEGKVVRDFCQSFIRLSMKLACLDEKDLQETNYEELQKIRQIVSLVKDRDQFKRAKFLAKVGEKVLCPSYSIGRGFKFICMPSHVFLYPCQFIY